MTMNKDLDNTNFSMVITESSYSDTLDTSQDKKLLVMYQKFLVDFVKTFNLDYESGSLLFEKKFLPIIANIPTSQWFQLSYSLVINEELINDILDIIAIEKKSSINFYIVNFPKNFPLINEVISHAFFIISVRFGIDVIGDIHYNKLEDFVSLNSLESNGFSKPKKRHHYINENKIRERFNFEIAICNNHHKLEKNDDKPDQLSKKLDMDKDVYLIEVEKIFKIENNFEYVSLLGFAMSNFTSYLAHSGTNISDEVIKVYIKYYEDIINKDCVLYQGISSINGDIPLNFIIDDNTVNILTIIPDKGFANIILELLEEINYCTKRSMKKIVYMMDKIVEVNYNVTITNRED